MRGMDLAPHRAAGAVQAFDPIRRLSIIVAGIERSGDDPGGPSE